MRRDGGVEAGLALVGVAAVEDVRLTRRPAWRSRSGRGRSRSAVVRDVDPAGRRRSSAGTAAALPVGVLDDERAARAQQPGARRRRTARTTSSPSGPPHSASAGSWSATSGPTPGAVRDVRAGC